MLYIDLNKKTILYDITNRNLIEDLPIKDKCHKVRNIALKFVGK